MSNKPGRNDTCPCGSGKKYKKCCGRDESVKSFLLPNDPRTELGHFRFKDGRLVAETNSREVAQNGLDTFNTMSYRIYDISIGVPPCPTN
jgi:hypothetical protein